MMTYCKVLPIHNTNMYLAHKMIWQSLSHHLNNYMKKTDIILPNILFCKSYR